MQMWWGHQIPAWYVLDESQDSVEQNTPYVVARNEEDALIEANKKFGLDIKLVRDKDVLDTWFSSGLWPFSTLGWPNINDPDFKKWYPNSVLVTDSLSEVSMPNPSKFESRNFLTFNELSIPRKLVDREIIMTKDTASYSAINFCVSASSISPS